MTEVARSNIERLKSFCEFIQRDFPEVLIAVHSNKNLFTGNHSYTWNHLLEREWSSDDLLEIANYDKSDFYPELFRNDLLTPKERKIALRQYEKDKFVVKNSNVLQQEPQIIKIEGETQITIRDLDTLLYDLFNSKRDRRSGKEFPEELEIAIANKFPYSYKMMKWYIKSLSQDL